MTINATLGEYGAQELGIYGEKAPLRVLEIWNVKVVLSDNNHIMIMIYWTIHSSQTLQWSEIWLWPRKNYVLGSIRVMVSHCRILFALKTWSDPYASYINAGVRFQTFQGWTKYISIRVTGNIFWKSYICHHLTFSTLLNGKMFRPERLLAARMAATRLVGY